MSKDANHRQYNLNSMQNAGTEQPKDISPMRRKRSHINDSNIEAF